MNENPAATLDPTGLCGDEVTMGQARKDRLPKTGGRWVNGEGGIPTFVYTDGLSVPFPGGRPDMSKFVGDVGELTGEAELLGQKAVVNIPEVLGTKKDFRAK